MEAAEGGETGDEVGQMNDLEDKESREFAARKGAFDKWLESTLGFSFGTFDEGRNDWTIAIRLHAMIETALNHMLTTHFKIPELAEVFAKMDTSDMKRGKLAFVMRLKLLPREHIEFIQKFSELRNFLVHNAGNFKLKLTEYPSKIKGGQGWIKLLARLGAKHIGDKQGEDAAIRFVEKTAMPTLRFVCFLILEHIFRSSGAYLPS